MAGGQDGTETHWRPKDTTQLHQLAHDLLRKKKKCENHDQISQEVGLGGGRHRARRAPRRQGFKDAAGHVVREGAAEVAEGFSQ